MGGLLAVEAGPAQRIGAVLPLQPLRPGLVLGDVDRPHREPAVAGQRAVAVLVALGASDQGLGILDEEVTARWSRASPISSRSSQTTTVRIATRSSCSAGADSPSGLSVVFCPVAIGTPASTPNLQAGPGPPSSARPSTGRNLAARSSARIG